MTCKRQRPPDGVPKDSVPESDYDYYYKPEVDKNSDIYFLQRAYAELAKNVFLPFLYGFNLSSVINCDIYAKAREHLKKVMQRRIDVPSDIAEIIEAVFALASTLNNSDSSDSQYLQKKVTQYLLFSQSRTEAMIIKKEEILSDLTGFKRKKDYVTRDPEMYDYLTVFMNVVTSAYRTSEAINKGIFQMAESDTPAIIDSGKACLELVPLVGGFLKQVADKAHSEISKTLDKRMKEKAKKTVNSFYHKEMEEVAEYVGVSFLYKYKDYFRTLVLNEKKKMGKDSYTPYTSKVTGLINKIVKDDAKKWAGIENPEKAYKTPAAILGFRDGNELVNTLIAEGELISNEAKVKFTKEEKVEKCISFVKNISEINRNVNKDTLMNDSPNCYVLMKDSCRDIYDASKKSLSKCTIF